MQFRKIGNIITIELPKKETIKKGFCGICEKEIRQNRIIDTQVGTDVLYLIQGQIKEPCERCIQSLNSVVWSELYKTRSMQLVNEWAYSDSVRHENIEEYLHKRAIREISKPNTIEFMAIEFLTRLIRRA